MRDWRTRRTITGGSSSPGERIRCLLIKGARSAASGPGFLLSDSLDSMRYYRSTATDTVIRRGRDPVR